MGMYAFLSAALVYVTLKEPQRGAKEEDLTEVLSKGTHTYSWTFLPFSKKFFLFFYHGIIARYQLFLSVALDFVVTIIPNSCVMEVIYHDTSCIALYSTLLYST
jgi:hypothetical protein